jgi:acyl-CoA synthetase (AMP-forming)/AMP-acid ligase II
MAPMPDTELKRAHDVMKCDFALVFGQTEMSPTTTLLRPHQQFTHSGAVGTPGINVQVAVMDDSGQLLPPGEKGEIVYRSPQVLTGYLYNEAATDEAFRHGWFHSGDAGYFDDGGVLWFEDRFKDVIKSGGENVASLEVEKALYEVEPRIMETAVVGLPHERWGEAVTAVVVPRPGEKLNEAELLARVQDHLSPFKRPKAVIIAEALPKTATGKIQKHELRKLYGKHYDR